jgi:acyl-CoA thioesterase FadM
MDRIGRTSLTLAVRFMSSGSRVEQRLSAKLTIVFVDIRTMQPIAIPSDLYRSIEALYDGDSTPD